MPKVEDRKLTPKENMLRMYRHEQQEWVPIYTMGMPLPDGEDIPMTMIVPSIIAGQAAPTGNGLDVWGVKWVGSDSAGGGRLPEPNNFILDDITRWRDVIKAPDLSDIDWEQMAKDDLKRSGVDREKTAIGQDTFIGPFQYLMAFMGFTEGMIALSEEPEEAHALLDYILDFYCEVQHKYYEALKPDVIIMADDTCAYAKPFISEEMFREFFVPCYIRECELPNQLGMPIQFHNCGKAANFIEICHEEANIWGWDPCQNTNDMVAFKKKHQNDISILGCFDPTGTPLVSNDATNEEVVAFAKEMIDTYAPDGGYAFMGGFVGPADDPDVQRKNKAVNDFAIDYCNNFYD
ncbi:MAG: uroporphyrinogen decarboxylase family protein [Coriobacteriales bacterium]|jgi:hypothetical protein